MGVQVKGGQALARHLAAACPECAFAFGGHFTGAPMALALGRSLVAANWEQSIVGYVAQHPAGNTSGLGPGCAASATTYPEALHCREYFPDDLLAAAADVLFTFGAFCREYLAAHDVVATNFNLAYEALTAFHGDDDWSPGDEGATMNATIFRRGAGADAPGDCMAGTSAEYVMRQSRYQRLNTKGTWLAIEHAGELMHSALWWSGRLEEGPWVGAWLDYVFGKAGATLDPLLALNGTESTAGSVFPCKNDRFVQHRGQEPECLRDSLGPRPIYATSAIRVWEDWAPAELDSDALAPYLHIFIALLNLHDSLHHWHQ